MVLRRCEYIDNKLKARGKAEEIQHKLLFGAGVFSKLSHPSFIRCALLAAIAEMLCVAGREGSHQAFQADADSACARGELDGAALGSGQ